MDLQKKKSSLARFTMDVGDDRMSGNLEVSLLLLASWGSAAMICVRSDGTWGRKRRKIDC